MDGFLLVDKPPGISSFGVVARVRGIIRAETGRKVKIGHTGTLDPAASGLMILVIGEYTKRAGAFSKLDKTYEAEATLGATSTTGDSEGETMPVSDKKPPPDEVAAVLKSFVGEIAQIPPAFSAIKVGGQRAYKLARAGKKVEIEPRKVKVHDIVQTEYIYPILRFITSVSSGTYIRTLVEDVGAELGTGAYMSALTRTKIADYSIDHALKLSDLNYKAIQSHLQK